MWFFTYKSGIHATIAGVLLASTIPHRIKDKDFSLLVKIEHAISPYVAFMYNATFCICKCWGKFRGFIIISVVLAPVPLGILCGLFLGNKLEFYYSLMFQLNLSLQKRQIIQSWYEFIWCIYFNWYRIYNEFICWKFSFC
jgi:Na+/H+ antiporter NhaA